MNASFRFRPGLAHFQRAGNKAHILFGIAFVSGEEPDPVREEQQYAHQTQRLHQRHDGGIAAKIDAQHGDVSHSAGHRAEQRRDIVNACNLMHHDARDECVGREHEHQQEERLEQVLCVPHILFGDLHPDESARDRLRRDSHPCGQVGVIPDDVGQSHRQHTADHGRRRQAEFFCRLKADPRQG